MSILKKVVISVGLLLIFSTILLFILLAPITSASIIAIGFLILAEVLLMLIVTILFDNEKFKTEMMIKAGLSTLGIIYLLSTSTLLITHPLFTSITSLLLIEAIVLLIVFAIGIVIVGFYYHDKKIKTRDLNKDKTEQNTPRKGVI